MILGIGCDITDIRRIEQALENARLKDRVFTKTEQRKAERRKKAGARVVAATYAKRFAAKEAAAKALGTGIGKDVRWLDMEVTNAKNGAPAITLSGAAAKRLKAITPKGKKARLLLALTDEYPFAQAWVMITA